MGIMKKLLLILTISLMSVGLFAVPTDYVVLLDVSQSALSIYDDLEEFLIKDILSNHIQIGDSFHLLSFADDPEFELSVNFSSPEDGKKILNRLALLNPLGKYTDLIKALGFVKEYANSVQGEGTLELIILTDGIHDPPPGRYGDDVDPAAEIRKITDEMGDMDVTILKFGTDPDEAAADGSNADGSDQASGSGAEGTDSQGNNLLDTMSNELQTDPIQVEGEENLANKALKVFKISYPSRYEIRSRNLKLPLGVENFTGETADFIIQEILLNGVNILNRPFSKRIREQAEISISLSVAVEPGDSTYRLELIPAEGINISPRLLNLTVFKNPFQLNLRPFLIVLAVLAGIIVVAYLAYLLFTLLNVDYARTQSYEKARKFDIKTHGKNRPIEMVVVGQTRKIGLRNIHWVGTKTPRTIGGKASFYVVLLYPLPSKIGVISCDQNRRFSFTPLKKDFFPELKSTLKDCLNTKIKVQVDEEKYIEIIFREWISPLERINAIMHLTDSPGLPKDIESIDGYGGIKN
jgi:hypothetical protein